MYFTICKISSFSEQNLTQYSLTTEADTGLRMIGCPFKFLLQLLFWFGNFFKLQIPYTVTKSDPSFLKLCYRS